MDNLTLSYFPNENGTAMLRFTLGRVSVNDIYGFTMCGIFDPGLQLGGECILIRLETSN